MTYSQTDIYNKWQLR